MISVERVTSSADVTLPDINELLRQLRTVVNHAGGTHAELNSITSDSNVIFVVAKDRHKTVGMGTIYLATKFEKKTGFVEDVVVSETYRGQGLGQKIMEILIDEARKNGATQLYLTSRPERVAAHKLYEKLGFKIKKTDVFKMEF